MQRAHGRDAAVKGKFFFRRHLAPLEKGDDGFDEQYVSMFRDVTYGNKEGLPTITSEGNLSALPDGGSGEIDGTEDGASEKRQVAPNASGGAEENSYEEMTMAEIMTGKGGAWMYDCPSLFVVHLLTLLVIPQTIFLA